MSCNGNGDDEATEEQFANNSSLWEFYKDANILITGGTGFVGKVLTEKLLRSCEGIKSINLLMRPKKGIKVEDRLAELLNLPIFNKIRKKQPSLLTKVKPICGDISLHNLGLESQQKNFIVENIHFVFHSAATVKFNENLKNAILHNTLGTQRVLDICKEMKHLKSFVYVSTAFSNADKEEIKEQVYKPSYDPEAILNCINILPPETIEVFTKRLLGKHPNTYTLSKAMAEYIVLENSSFVPSAIVRPSIITGAWKEPFPGWVDNVSGITGIFMECGRGTIKTIICNDKLKMDIIPVDIVVNTLITAAWHASQRNLKTVNVYNCTSGSTNPITWKEFGRLTHKYSIKYPSVYVTWYPGFTYRTNRTIHIICATLFHIIPSALLDIYLLLIKKKPIMLKISQKFYSALLAGSFFSTNQWHFETGSVNSLIKTVSNSDANDIFEMDINDHKFDWEDYVKHFILGVRQYVLKDELDTLPQARIKLKRLFWFRNMLNLIVLLLLGKLMMYLYQLLIV